MIIPDVNLLVYAHNDRAIGHQQAKSWWEDCLNGSVPVGLPWIVAAGFLRLMTHPRILIKPMPISTAVRHVFSWLDQPPVQILEPGIRFPTLFLGSLERLGTGGNLTTDAWLAALAIENRATLFTNDEDFSRFPDLRLKNPLKQA